MTPCLQRHNLSSCGTFFASALQNAVGRALQCARVSALWNLETVISKSLADLWTGPGCSRKHSWKSRQITYLAEHILKLVLKPQSTVLNVCNPCSQSTPIEHEARWVFPLLVDQSSWCLEIATSHLLSSSLVLSGSATECNGSGVLVNHFKTCSGWAITVGSFPAYHWKVLKEIHSGWWVLPAAPSFFEVAT